MDDKKLAEFERLLAKLPPKDMGDIMRYVLLLKAQARIGTRRTTPDEWNRLSAMGQFLLLGRARWHVLRYRANLRSGTPKTWGCSTMLRPQIRTKNEKTM